MEPIALERNISLRPMRKDDADALARNANNFNIWVNLRDGLPHPYTKKDALTFIDIVSRESSPKSLGICLADEVIGTIGITMLEDIYHKSAEFGYWLGEPYWRQGITFQAAKAFISYAFDTFKINRLQAGVIEWNTPSIMLLEKLGFRKEGVARKGVFKNDQFADEYHFGLLRDEWQV